MTLNINAHCRDCCDVEIFDEAEECIYEDSGYVPEFLGGGDDVFFSIDVETGQILDWDRRKKRILDFLEGQNEPE